MGTIMKGHARHLMTERFVTVSPATAITDVVRTFVAEELRGAPVIDKDHRVVGFISETDLLGALLRGDSEATTAGDVMACPPIVADEFMPAEEVISLLRDNDIHHLPVVREGRLVGIITPNDALRYFVEVVLPPPVNLA